MGARQSTNSLTTTGSVSNSPRMFSNPSSSDRAEESNDQTRRPLNIPSTIDLRQRARSLSSVIHGAGNTASGGSSRAGSSFFGMSGLSFGFGNALDAASPDSDTSTEDVSGTGSSRSTLPFSAHSLPVQFVPFNGIKCPVCSKTVLPDDIECHLVICLTKPRLNYNEDVLQEDKEVECVICLEELNRGETIARLPCLCIYHKKCIDKWFEVNRSCPEHPSD